MTNILRPIREAMKGVMNILSTFACFRNNIIPILFEITPLNKPSEAPVLFCHNCCCQSSNNRVAPCLCPAYVCVCYSSVWLFTHNPSNWTSSFKTDLVAGRGEGGKCSLAKWMDGWGPSWATPDLSRTGWIIYTRQPASQDCSVSSSSSSSG